MVARHNWQSPSEWPPVKSTIHALAALSAIAIAGCNDPASGGFPAASIEIVSGDGQVRSAGHAVRQPLTVKVSDPDGRPSAGVAVTFAALHASTTSTPVVVTDDHGRATLGAWTLRDDGVGTDTLRVSVEGAGSVSFTATVVFLVDISAGDGTTCGVSNTHMAFCWGDNTFGRLGTGDTIDLPRPAPVGGDLRFTKIATGGETCGLSLDAEILCAGLTEWLGEPHSDFREAGGGLKFRDLAVSTGGPRCGIGEDGIGYCWGPIMWVSGGESDPVAPVPFPASSNPPMQTISVSWGAYGVPEPGEMGCALDSKHHPSCWDLWGFYRVGYPQVDSAYEALTANVQSACGLAGVKVECFGTNHGYSLGVTDPVSFARVPIPPAHRIAAGSFRTCALTDRGIYCWGGNHLVEQVPGSDTRSYVRLSVSDFHGCVLDHRGFAWCWGANDYGELGDGTTNDSPSLVAVDLDY